MRTINTTLKIFTSPILLGTALFVILSFSNVDLTSQEQSIKGNELLACKYAQ